MDSSGNLYSALSVTTQRQCSLCMSGLKASVRSAKLADMLVCDVISIIIHAVLILCLLLSQCTIDTLVTITQLLNSLSCGKIFPIDLDHQTFCQY